MALWYYPVKPSECKNWYAQFALCKYCGNRKDRIRLDCASCGAPYEDIVLVDSRNPWLQQSLTR